MTVSVMYGHTRWQRSWRNRIIIRCTAEMCAHLYNCSSFSSGSPQRNGRGANIYGPVMTFSVFDTLLLAV